MKKKNKAKNLRGLLFALPVLILVVFFVTKETFSAGSEIVIVKVLYNPIGGDNKSGEEASYEMVEIKNISNKAVDISGWEIRMGTYQILSKISTPVPAGASMLIFQGIGVDKNLDFSEGKIAQLYRGKTASQLPDTKGDISLYGSSANNEGTIRDYVVYGKDFDFTASSNFTHAKNAGIWQSGDAVPTAKEGCAMELIKKEKNSADDWNSNCEGAAEDDEDDVGKICSANIYLNEIFPTGEEYVELINKGEEACNLKGWSVTDAVGYDPDEEALKTKSWGYHRSEFLESKTISPNGFAYFFDGDFLNSDDDKVKLFDAGQKKVQSVTYENAKNNLSFAFDGKEWRWSKPSKGSANLFNNKPYGAIEIDSKVYVKVYADFSVSTGDADGEKVKVTWDFGDRHKSYLADTRHKYEVTGIYAGSVKLSDGIEDVLKAFTIEVKKYPHPDVNIIAVNSNPKGGDAEFETITLENKSKKNLDLKGWSIATGTKKLVNHPITEKFVIKKKKTKTITKEESKFSLGNKKGKVELRYPDGKVASKMKYDHGKLSIADDEVYRKVKGEWEWKNVESIKYNVSSINTNAKDKDVTIKNAEIKEGEENKIEEVVVPVEIERENKLLTFSNDVIKIELLKSQPRVLGAEVVREVDGQYFFTPNFSEQEHYAVVFLKNIFSLLNSSVNSLLNNLK